MKLEGDRITADKFKKTVIAFYDLVDEVSTAVTGKKKSVDWIVSVRQGSIILQSMAEPKKIEGKEAEKIVTSLGSGLESLEESEERPEYFSERALDQVRVLSSVSDPKDNEFSSVKITTNGTPRDVTLHSAANIDSIQGYKTKGLGSVEGKLKAISDYGDLKIVVKDAITDRAVHCVLDDERLNEALSAFGKRVYVFGLINYDKEGRAKKITVQDLRIFPEIEDLPTASDVRGILKN